MRLRSVQKLEREALRSSYDLALFASGFEGRATFAHGMLKGFHAKTVKVLGFSEDRSVLSRRANDRYFAEQGLVVEIVESEPEVFFGSLLNDSRGEGEVLHVLVDYSVMTRSWYGAILSWAATREDGSPRVEIDFVYTHGKYARMFDPLEISDIVSIPGFEGISSGSRRTTAFFGLGFDKYATLAVLDRIEPDEVFCFIAAASDPAVGDFVRENNSELVQMAAAVVELPVRNVAESFRIICEYVLLIDSDTEVVTVPMGPKPHVLASLLAAHRMPRVACVHVRGSRDRPVEVQSNGTISCCRVIYE